MALPTIEKLAKVFNKVNTDCMRDGEDSIPFTDIEYYTEQIAILYDLSYEKAEFLATELANVK